MKYAVIFLCAGLVPAPSFGQSKNAYGAGMISCAEWTQYRQTNDKPNAYQVQAWVDGYLSGLNLAAHGDPDFLIGKLKSVPLYAWIDNYCQSNPLDPVATATFKLRKELLRRVSSPGDQAH